MPLSRNTHLIGLLAVCCGLLSNVCGQDVDLAVQVSDAEIPFAVEGGEIDLANLNDASWLRGSARRALAVGIYDLSLSLAKEAAELSGGDSIDFTNELVIVDSLLAQAFWVEVRSRLEALAAVEGAPADRLALRQAMIAFAENDFDGVAMLIAPITRDDLVDGDVAWFWFLNGWTNLAVGEEESAEESFETARATAKEYSPALSAQIEYLVFRSKLESQTDAAETIPQLQNALLENQGREVWYLYAQQLAGLLFDSGETEEAIALISRSLQTIPKELGREKAQLQLLATMAAGLERVEGRQALNELILANRFPDLMIIALQQAFSRARLPEGQGSGVIRALLERVIDAPNEHALLDQALYYRAVFRFFDGKYQEADDDAAELQRRFPNSSYRRGMLALQASSAWKRSRYRTAASLLQDLRADFVDLQTDFRLSALIADCYLRAGQQSNTREDYRNAAGAYATALGNVKSSEQGGPLFFNMIFSRLRAGQLDLALESIDDFEFRSLAGPETIWRAQWVALRELRRVGRDSDAYERCQEALRVEAGNPFLKLRLLWLAARLSVVSGDAEYTIDWVDEIEEFVNSEALADADPGTREKVLASSWLSLSESYFALGEPDEAVALLKRLRTEYPEYESAVWSYISEARYYSKVNRTVNAQQLLISMADKYKDHRLAPLALFEAALNAEQRGQDTYLDEATKLLQRIASDYPDSAIVYRARLMQADLLRRLNKFASAEQIYYRLEVEYSDRQDRFLAQMSMAATLLAQAGEDPSKFDLAVSRLELLRDLPEAPIDLRVEAGYQLGQAWWSRKGDVLRAKQIFWLLYDQVLGDDLQIRRLNPKGRYWMARCLFGLAEIASSEGKIDEANFFYLKVIEYNLNGVEVARDRLKIMEAPTDGTVAN